MTLEWPVHPRPSVGANAVVLCPHSSVAPPLPLPLCFRGTVAVVSGWYLLALKGGRLFRLCFVSSLR